LHALDRTIRRERPAIVHLHTCSGFSFFRSVLDLLIARRRRCRTILHVHGAAFDEFHARAGSLSRRLIAWSLARADRVIALSETWQRKLRQMADSAQLCVVENAVAYPRSTPSLRQEGPCRFLLLARMDEWKGIDDLLEACARLHADGVAFELTLAGPPGTAGDATALDRKIHVHGLEGRVRYAGPVYGGDKLKLLEWADVYVQPSHHEGMPLSLLEALAYGLAIVATRVGAVPEVIADQVEGVLVPPGQPAQLASAMRRLVINPEERRSMGRASRELALTRFSLDRFRRDLIELYDDLSAAPPGSERTVRPQHDRWLASKDRCSWATGAASPSVPR
jgi:glycosyltransferase involved in cell wall biosynthesis